VSRLNPKKGSSLITASRQKKRRDDAVVRKVLWFPGDVCNSLWVSKIHSPDVSMSYTAIQLQLSPKTWRDTGKVLPYHRSTGTILWKSLSYLWFLWTFGRLCLSWTPSRSKTCPAQPLTWNGSSFLSFGTVPS
jgi:hypothetical protein